MLSSFMSLLAALAPGRFSERLELTTPPDMRLAAPIKTWDEAIPLGNGSMGVLLWGDDKTLKVSLDRADLWDLNSQPETFTSEWTYGNVIRLIEKKDQASLERLFDAPYDKPTPTKLPGIRLELPLPANVGPQTFTLSLATGAGSVTFKSGQATFVLRRDGPVLVGHLPFGVGNGALRPSSAVNQLGYPPAQVRSENRAGEDGGQWAQQDTNGKLSYAAYYAYRATKTGTDFAVSFTTNAHNRDALKDARTLARSALRKGLAEAADQERDFWTKFWAVSSVQVPDKAIQAQYDLAQYFYGAGTKRGGIPLGLQGVWTADAGTLPPWKGDFHHDLNTQLIYWPYLAAGHWDEGGGLLDFLWSELPRYQQFAREFYNTPGAAIPGVTALDGQPLGGWAMYSLSPTMGPWLATAFVDHWRYTADPTFLKTRAYPFCKELATCLQLLLRKGTDGKWKLQTSSSPEIHDNSLGAWLAPNSNFDLAILKKFFGDLTEMAAALHLTQDEGKWRILASELDDFAISKTDGGLMVDRNQDLTESHRHFSHLLAIHPFGLLNTEGSPEDQKVIEASLAHLKPLGTDWWCGYSFSWMACMQARTGHAEAALQNLSIYTHAFVLRNGFHANGDQSGKGYSRFTYRPFTLEGNMAAAQAVHEMLLQSWGGKVRIFPAVPTDWKDASFTDLRAEGGFVVTATRASGVTTQIRIVAPHGGRLIAVADREMRWSTPKGPVTARTVTCDLRPGQVVTALP